MASHSKPQIPSGFDRAFGSFPEIPGANGHRIADAVAAAWGLGSALAGRFFDRTVPMAEGGGGNDHPVLSFSLSRSAAKGPLD